MFSKKEVKLMLIVSTILNDQPTDSMLIKISWIYYIFSIIEINKF